MSKRINIAIIDQEFLTSQISQLFSNNNKDIYLLAHFSSINEAIENSKTLTIDILLVNVESIFLKSANPFKEMLKVHSKTKIVAYNIIFNQQMLDFLNKIGTHGYIFNETSLSELYFAIKDVHAGNYYFSKNIKTFIELSEKENRNKHTIPLLSKREKEIIRYIMDEKNVMEISEILLISKGTVETHRQNIMSKLGTKNSKEMVKFVLENRLL